MKFGIDVVLCLVGLGILLGAALVIFLWGTAEHFFWKLRHREKARDWQQFVMKSRERW